jgi:hypothetical protein
MSVCVEALFTSALGLKLPWEVGKVDLDTAKRRIDFELAESCKTARRSGLLTGMPTASISTSPHAS